MDTAQRILHLLLVSNECINIIDTLKDEIQILERRHVRTYFQAELQDGQNKESPKYKISEEQITLMLNLRFSIPEIAKLFNVSVSTVKRRMAKYGCCQRSVYSTITDDELDNLLSTIISENPQTGYKRMIGYLKVSSIIVQEKRLREAIRRVHPEGIILRSLLLKVISRRKYNVKGTNSLWHIKPDGNHILIR